eukprot:SAG31_NODE_20516_length_572_cov_0.951374_1_plen_60_part_10
MERMASQEQSVTELTRLAAGGDGDALLCCGPNVNTTFYRGARENARQRGLRRTSGMRNGS